MTSPAHLQTTTNSPLSIRPALMSSSSPPTKRRPPPPPPPPPPPAAAGEESWDREQQPLLPGLPDHLAQLCLSHVPASLMYSVCRPWRRLLYSPSFPPFLSLYALLSSPSLLLYSFDPLSTAWHLLPTPPSPSPLLRHRSFLSRPLPVQSLSASRRLLLLAASSPRLLPALPCPVAFDPSSSSWIPGPQFIHPRRWCVSAASPSSVFLFSGVGAEYSPDVARSAERWDLSGPGAWERLSPLKNSRFCREPVDAVAARGRLYMVNVRGRCPREGAVYDISADRWEEMPPGMLSGWTGPAAAAEDTGGGAIYMVGEGEGVLWEYQWRDDTWREIVKADELKGAIQMAAGGGRVCVVVGGGAAVAVVDIGRGKIWVVDPPEGKQIMAVHVLPRMIGVAS